MKVFIGKSYSGLVSYSVLWCNILDKKRRFHPGSWVKRFTVHGSEVDLLMVLTQQNQQLRERREAINLEL